MLGGLLVLTLVALLVDGRVATAMLNQEVGKQTERITDLVLNFGVVLVMLALLSSFENRRYLWGGFLLTMLPSTAVLHLLKLAIGRARPLAEAGPFVFRPFTDAQYFDAFPSGHTTAAATLALLLAAYYPHGRWVFYLLAVAVGVNRVATGWHWVSDVLAGYVLAGLTVYVAMRLLGPLWFYPTGLRQR